MKKPHFFTHKKVQYIIVVGDFEFTTMSRISKKVGMTAGSTFIMTKYLESLGVIKTSKIGKFRKIELTDKGSEIYKHLKEISSIINE